MSWFDGLRHQWQSFRYSRQHERDAADELQFHVEREAAQQAHDASRRLTAREATEAARRQVGNLTAVQEATRQASGLAQLDVIGQDVRFAVRSFRSAPLFTVVVVVTLALGIGATTAIFSAVDALLLRPLPFRDPSELMSISLVAPEIGDRPSRDDVQWSYPKFQAFKERQHVFADLTFWSASQFTLRAGGDSRRISGEYTDSHYLTTLGIPLAIGRNFSPDEDRVIGGPQVVILSYSLWRTMFNGDSSVLNKRADVDGRPYTVVGVAAPEFQGVSGSAEILMPVTSAPLDAHIADPMNHAAFAIARVAPGISIEQAKAATTQVGLMVDAAYPAPIDFKNHWGAVARELDSMRAHPQTRRTLYVLLGAVALVLLTACANVANLLLVRAWARQREIAVRLALGASRGRLIRQLLVESVLLAVVGAAASIVVAAIAVKLLSSVQSVMMRDVSNASGMGTVYFSVIKFDLKAFLCTASLALATGLMFGLVPALQSTRPSVTNALKESGNSVSIGRRRISMRHVLTIAEIAFAVVLLAASGLMIQTVNHLVNVRAGFDATQVASIRVNRSAEWSRDSIEAYYDEALRRLSVIPGVTAVAMGDCPPLVRCAGINFWRTDRAAPAPGTAQLAGMHWITPDWTKVLRIPLVRGRLLSRDDNMNSPKVVIINETAARRAWPNEDPIGKRIAVSVIQGKLDTAEVIGVVGDVRYESIDSLPKSDIYVSYYQTHLTWRMMFFVRSQSSVDAITARALQTLKDYTPGFPLYDVRTMDGRVSDATAYARITMVLLVSFAAVALLLATIGTYGVVAFSVSQRTREIGVRVALGATNANITRLVVWQGIALASVGVVFGLGMALVATRALQSLLYNITPSDPLTMMGIVVVLTVAVVVATWIPVKRAMRVTPASVLRAQ